MCLMLGFQSRTQLHDLPLTEYREWEDYFLRHPRHYDTADEQVALVAYLVASMMKKQGGKDFKIEDFRALRFETGSKRADGDASNINMGSLSVRKA